MRRTGGNSGTTGGMAKRKWKAVGKNSGRLLAGRWLSNEARYRDAVVVAVESAAKSITNATLRF